MAMTFLPVVKHDSNSDFYSKSDVHERHRPNL